MAVTTREQSKTLIDLGLDPGTADFCYRNTSHIRSMVDADEWVLLDETPEFDEDIPAWSFDALFSLMPQINYGYPFLGRVADISTTPKYFMQYRRATGEGYKTGICHTPVEAAYEMIVLLLKNRMINHKTM